MGRIVTVDKLIDAFVKLGNELLTPDEELVQLIDSAKQYNGWFTPENTRQAIYAIGAMLNRTDLTKWLSALGPSIKPHTQAKQVGLILPGNLPAVGCHDVFCVLAAGHKGLIKLSSQDQYLIPYIIKKLIAIEPFFENKIAYIDRLKNFDAVIATGSNNTSRYFDYYFKNVPHIIRKNRNSVAVLTGEETTANLEQLGHDIFDYFGLGCRNVSKLYVPKGYNFNHFFESIESFKGVADLSKYNNNYDYNKSIFLVNSDKHLDNGFLLLKANDALQSPLATLYYQEYENIELLTIELVALKNQIQCIVINKPLLLEVPQVGFGNSQKPKLWDYADSVNTMQFLLNL